MSNLAVMKRKKLETIHKIETYCNMNNKAKVTMAHFEKKKRMQAVKAVIKNPVIFGNYLKGVSYINPHVMEFIRSKNHKNAQKIANYIYTNFSITL